MQCGPDIGKRCVAVELDGKGSEGVSPDKGVVCFSINTLSFGYKCSYYSAGEIYKYLRLSQMHTMHIPGVVHIHKSCSIHGHGYTNILPKENWQKNQNYTSFTISVSLTQGVPLTH
jgi:hypothetical protein